MAIKELFYDQRPVALLNPRASQRIDPRFKFSRDCTKTYIDTDGVLQTVAKNTPIIGWDQINLQPDGLLLEPSRTNQLINSSSYGSSGWDDQNVTYGTGVTAPDGTSTSTKIIPTTDNIEHYFRKDSNTTIIGEYYTASIFAKKGEYDVCSLTVYDGGAYRHAYYDLDTGSVTKITAGGGDQYMIPLADGWYRLVSTQKAVGNLRFRFYVLNGNSLASYVGNGTDGLFAWGAQLERSETVTSYIPTGGATVTREADLLSIESLSVPSSGSIYIDARAIDTNVDSTLLSLKNASNQKINLAMEQRSELYNSLALTYSIKGTVKPTLPYPVPTTNRERNIITWGTNNYQYNTDGARFAPSLSTTPGIPADLTQLSIGHDAVDPTKAFNGYINAVYLYNGEITPTVAEALVRGELDPINADTYSPVGPTGSLALIINTQGATSSGDKVFALPAESALNDNDIVITWGDGTESGLDGAAAELGAPGLSHTYPSAGIYPVWVEGQLENLQFNNSASAPDLVKIEKWGTTADGNDVFLSPSTMNSAFYGCSKLTSMPSSGLPDTSAVTDWYRAFRDCSSITGTFPSFNFSAATSFQEAWYGCSGMTSFTAAGDQTENVTNFSNAWYNCTSLTSFPLINTAAGTNFSAAWRNCSSLTNFPLIDTAAGTYFSDTWRDCTGLTSFPLINTAAGTNFFAAWYNCNSLTSFPLINTAAGTNFSYAWYNCNSLTSFPLINTAAGTNFSYAWLGCTSLTSFPLINTAAGTNFSNAWYSCSSLTSFPLINTAAGTNFSNAWYNCTSLTSFPLINTAAGTNFSYAWYSCSSLTSFPLIDTSAGTSFPSAWHNCSSLTSFPSLDMSAAVGLASQPSNTYTGFRNTWRDCTSLTDFPANRFDTTTCTRFLDAFRSCALTAQSIENILVSINTANTSNGNLSLQGGTNAAKTTWSTAANNAYNALVARGWTITFNA